MMMPLWWRWSLAKSNFNCFVPRQSYSAFPFLPGGHHQAAPGNPQGDIRLHHQVVFVDMWALFWNCSKQPFSYHALSGSEFGFIGCGVRDIFKKYQFQFQKSLKIVNICNYCVI
jgi:hypothetical protein